MEFDPLEADVSPEGLLLCQITQLKKLLRLITQRDPNDSREVHDAVS
jgi:hypothetical protein